MRDTYSYIVPVLLYVVYWIIHYTMYKGCEYLVFKQSNLLRLLPVEKVNLY